MEFVENRPHKKLVVWQKSMEFVSSIYESTNKFPNYEEYGLTSQLRRAAISVPSNLAEGLSRKAIKEKLHYLNIAQGSLSEIDTQLEIAFRLGFLNKNDCESLNESLILIQKLLSGLRKKLNSD